MDCTATDGGWFELKAYITNDVSGSGVWESDVTQWSQCNGDVGGYMPYSSTNHVAKCGFINVFHVQDGACTISSFQDIPVVPARGCC